MKKICLVVDLDGTFLEGTISDKEALYTYINHYREEICLVFCTGRCIEHVNNALEDTQIPKPDIIICDVGTTIYDFSGRAAIKKIQSDIASLWPGQETIASALDDHPHLQLQNISFRYRRSYNIQDESSVEIIKQKAESLNCDALFSHGVFVDILPKNINKGSTLIKLIEALDIDPDSVLTAGDTMNDFSMLTLDFKSVVLSNASDSLKQAAATSPNTYFSKAPGTKGILEALIHFELLASQSYSKGDPDNIIAYHRPLHATQFIDGEIRTDSHQSPNGILPTLASSIKQGKNPMWVCSIPFDDEESNSKKTEILQIKDGTRYLYLLEKEDYIKDFYQDFSKNNLWPVLHSYHPTSDFCEKKWINFLRINYRYAIAIATHASTESNVHFHDYNLWMAPYLLKRLRPDLSLLFFHHTPFPHKDFFLRLPCAIDILNSLSQCDNVYFHTTLFMNNCAESLQSELTIIKKKSLESERLLNLQMANNTNPKEYSLHIDGNNHFTQLKVNPVGIDIQKIKSYVHSKPPHYFDTLQIKTHPSQKLIASVERMDYTKGIKEKLQAIEHFLITNPSMHENVKFILIIVPPHNDMSGYDETIDYTLKKISIINGTYGSLNWTPLRFIYKKVSYNQLMDLYAISDTMLITSTADGLNLVAKEFIAVKKTTNRLGSLILSQFAGASEELEHAQLINPFDKEQVSRAIKRAITSSEEEQKAVIDSLSKSILTYDINHWVKNLNTQRDLVEPNI